MTDPPPNVLHFSTTPAGITYDDVIQILRGRTYVFQFQFLPFPVVRLGDLDFGSTDILCKVKPRNQCYYVHSSRTACVYIAGPMVIGIAAETCS